MPPAHEIYIAADERRKGQKMTVSEAIARVDLIRPNVTPEAEKLRLLSELDGKIKIEIIDTHEGGENITFAPYTDADGERSLLVPAPHDGIYLHYLSMHIAYAQRESKAYNAASVLFNTALADYKRYYNANNMPRQARKRVF